MLVAGADVGASETFLDDTSISKSLLITHEDRAQEGGRLQRALTAGDDVNGQGAVNWHRENQTEGHDDNREAARGPQLAGRGTGGDGESLGFRASRRYIYTTDPATWSSLLLLLVLPPLPEVSLQLQQPAEGALFLPLCKATVYSIGPEFRL